MNQQPADEGRADIHVCLISQQATPNLTPLLDPSFAPRQVVMLVSAEMRERARWLADVIKPRGISVQTLEVSDPWDMQALVGELLIWLDKLDSESTVALNVTGGTKPMAMAAQQAFAIADRPVFYVHQAHDEVMWLTPDKRPARALVNRLKLEDYLHAHGWQVINRPPPPARSEPFRRLTDELAMQVGSLAPALGTLNWYAQRCHQEQRLEIALEKSDAAKPGFVALLQKFSAAGACTERGGRLSFPNEDARFFCNGGWLEHHVHGVLAGIKARTGAIQDLAMGLKVRSLDNRLKGNAGSNELDLAFLAHNRLHIVECKTRSFGEHDSSADAVYKLDALTALGGLNTQAMLVSYRELQDGDRQRAHDLRIQTVVGGGINNLEQLLLRWMGGASST